MKILCELLSDDIAITEKVEELGEGKTRKNMYIEGVTLQSEVKNGNGRVYPKAILGEAIGSHVKKFLNAGRAVGELDHPKEDSAQINPDRISHRFTEVKEDGNNFITKAMVLNTTKGTQVQNLIDGGVKMGISSRGFGDVKESNGAKVVQSLYLVSLGDIVTNPSAPDAFLTAVMENQEWVWENGALIGKDLSQDLNEYKQAFDKASPKERDTVAVAMFKEYFASISEARLDMQKGAKKFSWFDSKVVKLVQDLKNFGFTRTGHVMTGTKAGKNLKKIQATVDKINKLGGKLNVKDQGTFIDITGFVS